MIEEIISYRRQGMSFRKIAEKLNSTVGKVHYQWIKNVKNDSTQAPEKSKQEITSEERKNTDDHYLVARIVSDNKIASFWKIAAWQKQLVESYFHIDLIHKLIIFRIYDVTDIIFNGSNAHSFFEFQIPEDKSYWIIKGIKPGRSYITEIGYRLNERHYFPILRSNAIYGEKTIEEKNIQLTPSNEGYQKPNWLGNVSTYSFYENTNKGKVEDE